MKLYQSIGPNPRVTSMFIAEAGIGVPRQMVDIMAGENRQPAYLALNPTGGVPVLETDDGAVIPESIAICEYLAETAGGMALIGETPTARAATRAAVRAIDQGVVVPMTSGFRGAEGNPMFKDRVWCEPEAAPGNKRLAANGLAAIDRRLAAGGPYVCGAGLTLADILLFAFTEFGALVGQPLADDLTALKAWSARVGERPSAQISANPKNGL